MVRPHDVGASEAFVGRLTAYTAREVVTPAIGTLGVTTFLLLTTQILRIGEAAFGYGLTAGDFLLILALLLPRFFVFTLPIAVLVGVVGGLGRLAADREILAMEAAGLSPARLWPGPIALGIGGTALTLFLSMFGEPWAMTALSERLSSVVERNLAAGITPGVVHEEIPGMVLFAEGREDDGTLNDVLVHLQEGRVEGTVVARRARLLPAGGAGLRLSLEEGELVRAEPGTPPVGWEFDRTRFERGRIDLDVSRTVSRRVRFIGSLDTLDQPALARHARSAPPDEALKARVILARRLAVPFGALAFAFLGMPLGLARTGRREGGRSYAFVAGLGVVLADYLLVRLGEAAALSGRLPIQVALWAPNLLMGLLGAFLLWQRGRR